MNNNDHDVPPSQRYNTQNSNGQAYQHQVSSDQPFDFSTLQNQVSSNLQPRYRYPQDLKNESNSMHLWPILNFYFITIIHVKLTGIKYFLLSHTAGYYGISA